MKPLIKWVGGKSGNLNYIRELLPKNFNTYYEPFIGSGALLFDLCPSNAVINDINSELINFYNQIKCNKDQFFKSITMLIEKSNSYDMKDFYYIIRDEYNNNLNSNTAEQAVRFLFLNKHCFNGLYRVNKSGKFNVPFNGNYKFSFPELNDINNISEYLNKNIIIYNKDFIEITKNCMTDDFVFFDSPYVPLTATTFVDYSKDGFSYDRHIELADEFKRLSKNNVYCMLTNHDTELIRDLYNKFNIKVIDVKRNINSNGSNRTGKEVIITNYDYRTGTIIN